MADRRALVITTPGVISLHEAAELIPEVSSVAFGGADLSTLYITTARANFTPDDLRASLAATSSPARRA